MSAARTEIRPLRIMGVDPGLATAGFGVIDLGADKRSRLVGFGDFTSPSSDALAPRLRDLAAWLREAIACHRPDEIAIEEMFFALNVKTAVQMAHGRGACLVAAAEAGLPVVEYSALSIKQSVAGYGRADKDQVARMVARALGLDALPQPSHAADALAVALCHAATKKRPAVAGLTAARAKLVQRNSRRRGKSAWRSFSPARKKS